MCIYIYIDIIVVISSIIKHTIDIMIIINNSIMHTNTTHNDIVFI